MTLRHRPYQRSIDLLSIGQLIRGAYASNRLRAMGCPLVTVQSWSTSEGANKLYQAAGLLPKDNQLNWCWRKT